MSNSFNQVIVKTRLTEIHHLETMGLSLEDAEDIFQEASVVLYDIMSSQRLTMKSTPEAYLHGICQNMAYKRMEELKKLAGSVDDDKLNRLLSLTDECDEDMPDAIAEEDDNQVDYESILLRLLNKLSARDYSLIHGFYIEGKSFEILAEENNLASVEVARTTKCRIISRLREQANDMIKKYF